MLSVGILSDTHGYLHPRIPGFFSDVGEIWHAGDIGSPAIIRELARIRPVRAVYGNIDGRDVRQELTEHIVFTVEGVKVLMTHIGGYPGRYDRKALAMIVQERPGLFICGHSHILKVMYDAKHRLLHINPGAGGIYGMHRSITAVRLVIDGAEMRDLEVLDLPRKPNNS